MSPNPTQVSTAALFPENGGGQSRRSAGSPFAILLFLGVVVFLLATVVAGGLYVYRASLKRDIAALEETIGRYRDTIEKSSVEELIALDARLGTASTLLANHASVSAVFDALERETIVSISYVSFSYAPETRTITVGIVAKNDLAFAEQLAKFEKSSMFADAIFSGLSLNPQTGVVTATLTLRFIGPLNPPLTGLLGGGNTSTTTP